MDEYSVFNDVSFQNVPSDEECIFNAVQIGKIIEEPASTIRTWAELHGKYMYIKKINKRFVYTQASIEEFRFIQDLVRNKGFTHDLVREQIKKRGFHYKKYDSGLINPQDPLGFEALATQIMLKNQEQLKQFMIGIYESNQNLKEELKVELKHEIGITVDEHLENKLNDIKSYFDQREFEQRQKDVEMIDTIRKHLEDTKKDAEENKKKGFWNRIFNKNK